MKMKKRKKRKELHWRLTYKMAQPSRPLSQDGKRPNGDKLQFRTEVMQSFCPTESWGWGHGSDWRAITPWRFDTSKQSSARGIRLNLVRHVRKGRRSALAG